MQYHRVVVTRYGGPDVLQVMEGDLPEPRAGEARVKVPTAGVSAYDVMLQQSGSLPGSPRVPFTPGADVVGVADMLGEGVSTAETGDGTITDIPRPCPFKMIPSLRLTVCSLCQCNSGEQSRSRVHFQP